MKVFQQCFVGVNRHVMNSSANTPDVFHVEIVLPFHSQCTRSILDRLCPLNTFDGVWYCATALVLKCENAFFLVNIIFISDRETMFYTVQKSFIFSDKVILSMAYGTDLKQCFKLAFLQRFHCVTLCLLKRHL